MSGIAMILPMFQAVGTIFSAFSQSSASSNAGAQQQQAAEYNAAVARNNAIAARQAAEADALTQDTLNNQKMGTMEAQLAKSGVAFEGTPLMLLANEAGQGSLEKAKIKQRGEVQARNYEAQAAQDQYAGQQAAAAGNSKSGSTLLTGVLSGVGQGLKGFGIGGS